MLHSVCAMPQAPPAKASSEAINWPVLAAVVAGISGGLILSVPLSRLIKVLSSTTAQPFALPQPQPAPLANPFVGWTGFGAREVVVLGRDRTGSTPM